MCEKSGRLEVDHVKPLEDGGALYALGEFDVAMPRLSFRQDSPRESAPADVAARACVACVRCRTRG